MMALTEVKIMENMAGCVDFITNYETFIYIYIYIYIYIKQELKL